MAASTFRPPINPRLRNEVEMRHMPSVPDNIKHWQVFEDDQQIHKFLTTIEDFQGTEINQDGDETTKGAKVSGFKNSIVNQKIIQLKDNILPRGLVPLEILFNSNDVAVSSEKVSQDEKIQDHNIGNQKEPKLVELFKGVPFNYKERYIELF